MRQYAARPRPEQLPEQIAWAKKIAQPLQELRDQLLV
jgi:hypothetical protein